MKSICFFSSYFKGNEIPYYIKFYLEELQRHFVEVVLLTNEKSLTEKERGYLEKRKIQLRLYKNEGFDFGMWIKAFREFAVLDYDRIGLMNDSCILFKKLDFIFEWIDNSSVDYCGMTDSNALAYHIQSYFLVINKSAIGHLSDYFKQHEIVNEIKAVIHKYEVGLSQYLLEKQTCLGAYFSNVEYRGEHNPMLLFSDRLIRQGMPLIKKKIIFNSFRTDEYLSLKRMNFNIDPLYHIDLIKKVNENNDLIDFNLITSKVYNGKFIRRIWVFKLKSFLFQILRKFKIRST